MVEFDYVYDCNQKPMVMKKVYINPHHVSCVEEHSSMAGCWTIQLNNGEMYSIFDDVANIRSKLKI